MSDRLQHCMVLRDKAQEELNAAIDDVCEWLDYQASSVEEIEQSIKRLNRARLRFIVAQFRERQARNTAAGR